MTWNGPLNKIDDFRYEIPNSYKGVNKNLKMKTSALIYASEKMIPLLKQDNAPEQTANMTMLPGIVGKAMAMPDIHWGYGFPIGGVAATDAEEGVISPGGVGFDINCIHGDAMILHEHGYRMRIKDFENTWENDRIKCANFGEKIKNTDINAYMQFETEKKIYEVSTESGEKIIATEDHPFYTPNGMIPLNEIKNPGMIAVYPFEGVDYSKPADEVIISEEDILNLPLKKNLSQTIDELKKRDLLPLKSNNEKLPYLLKLMGYIFGDGTLYFSKNKGTIWLYGEPEDLEELRKDVKRIGFNGSRIYKRERNHKIETMYDTIRFQREEHSVKLTSSSLAALLWAMGTPCGNKSDQKYTVPSWIFKLTLWQKRLFISSFFGAELSSPSTVTKHDYNFYPQLLSMNKHEQYLESGYQFLNDIKKLLKEFDVSSNIINKRKEYVNKQGAVSYRLRLQISSSTENLLNLWKKIGFEYNKKRRHLANSAIYYLQLKKKVLNERILADKKAKQLQKDGVSPSKIFRLLESRYVNKRFLERSLYDERKTPPRVAFNFLKFKEFLELKTKGLGNSGILWDKIIQKRIVQTDGKVYDFTVADSHHNFIANNFVVSNCGVRLVRTNLSENDLNENIVRQLVDKMFKNVPSGLGSKAKVRLNNSELSEMLTMGARWAVDQGYGWDEDPLMLEEEGCLDEADVSQVSSKAMKRGIPQVGSLGAGNHFLEIQRVADIYDEDVAKTFGITEKGQITVMIHTGSRGFGHQVCSDHLRTIEKAVKKYNVQLPDKQLACAPVDSLEGRNYLKAMSAAANFAWCNRQMIVHWVRESFESVLNSSAEDLGMHIVYDVCHNIAKREDHVVDGEKRKLIVHRKGATRAFGPSRSEIPSKYQDVGQPVLIPGDMGTESYVLHGVDESEETFGSTCHGAGRVMSRTKSRKKFWGEDVVKDLGKRGIYVHPASFKVAAEEASGSYKNIREVVDTVDGAGISKKVVRLEPLGVVKG
ncbi:MAG: intein-containing RctB family protein [Candidatus Thermoplasmatota archaeon]|nr:intein-containing RctB family protein [Candidatus Thermoplasmatota archaeon]